MRLAGREEQVERYKVLALLFFYFCNRQAVGEIQAGSIFLLYSFAGLGGVPVCLLLRLTADTSIPVFFRAVDRQKNQQVKFLIFTTPPPMAGKDVPVDFMPATS